MEKFNEERLHAVLLTFIIFYPSLLAPENLNHCPAEPEYIHFLKHCRFRSAGFDWDPHSFHSACKYILIIGGGVNWA